MLSDTSLGIYIYCLARARVSFPHTMMGIDGIHGVYLAEQDGIFAVISDVSLKEYNEEALEKNMIDVAWLVPRAKRHEEGDRVCYDACDIEPACYPEFPPLPPVPHLLILFNREQGRSRLGEAERTQQKY